MVYDGVPRQHLIMSRLESDIEKQKISRRDE
jgi:hypothetical protein